MSVSLSKPAVHKIPPQAPARLIVGISGASGVAYGIKLLQSLKALNIETHLVMSKTAELTLGYETDTTPQAVKALATRAYDNDNFAAPFSSGSFKSMGMIIAPCSVRSLAEIASGVTTGLLTRAADVMLKERRKLVIMLRETPLHSGHIRNMLTVSDLGAIIAPPLPAFYPRPESIDDIVAHGVGRVLDLFGLESGEVVRWGEKRVHNHPGEETA